MGKSYEEVVAAREKDISDRRNEDAKLEEAKEKLKGFEDLLKNKDVLAEKVLDLEKILKNRNEVVESLNNELSESRRRLEENALLQKEFDDKIKKSEKLAEQKQGGIEGLNNTIQSKTTAMTSLSDEIFEKEKQLKAVIADKLVFEKKANDCEKIIEEQCCQLASLTKELECAKGLAEDTSLRLSEYESKTQKLEGILRILKDEHCEKYAELKEASDNLIVANKKNNSLAEALSEYELKLKEMKEKEKEEHYQKDAELKEASSNSSSIYFHKITITKTI
ncbi:myosin heavy chain, cardiac muscle isoform-like [Artemia franciscana]|uniref:myosin heavy chain, cardiac muscle isoform-like n=1 Tax=Artemia franciscana TaxID=6661 RepID=UPI0032DB7D58